MKRIIVIIMAAVLLGTNASAQSILDILKKGASSVSSDTTASSGSILDMASSILGNLTGKSTISLPGTWTYTKPAVILNSDNALSQVAATAAQSTIESKVNEYLTKVGITSGSIVFTFATDSTFTCQFKNRNLGGTWSFDQSTNAVNLDFGKTMKYYKMEGIAKKTTSGIEILFTADKFLSFMKTALSVVKTKNSSGTLSTISSLLQNYDGMYLGLHLKQ